MSDALEFEVFTIFPAAIRAFVDTGLLGKALARGQLQVHCTDLREFCLDRHRNVDDAPFGGGAGMVFRPEPVVAAIEAVTAARGPMHRILLTPSGTRFDQRVAERLATLPRIALLCGRYEGIDDRVREGWVDECLSIGDFVLNGGEVAAAAVIEAVARLREGVLGNPESIEHESFAGGDEGLVVEHPHYTRPASFRGREVPELLLRGDHAEVELWRRRMACLRTWLVRPELRPRRGPARRSPLDLDRLAREPGLGDLPEGAAALPGVSGLLTHARTADLRTLRRTLKRRHGVAPELVAVVVGPIETSLPQAHSGAALLDLLALSGDLSAPLVLLLCPTPTALGDLTPASPSAREEPQDASSWPSALRAVFALDPLSVEAAALELARWAPMIDSSPPQPVCGSAITIAAAALSELRTPAAR